MPTTERPNTTATGQYTPGPHDPELKEAGQLRSPTWELELFLSGAFVFATAVARTCPTLKPLQDRGLSFGADPMLADSVVFPVLACLAKLHAVTLDGAPQSSLDFAFYEHPNTGLKGMIAYIPVDSLARGRHVISVMPVPPSELPTDSAKLANASWKKPIVIPFWK